MKPKIEAGLVFAIRLLNEQFGFGQLVLQQAPIFYMVAFDVLSEIPSIDDNLIQRFKPLLMGNFFDVLIRNGRWAPVRHIAPPVVPYPCFKVRIGDSFYVESWDRLRKREATEEDLKRLQPRSNYGPIILENALNAHFALRPWEPMFESLKAEVVSSISTMC